MLPTKRSSAVAALAAGCLLAASCSSSKSPSASSASSSTSASAPSSSTTAAAGTRGSGPVDVLYAGSLVDLMDDLVGPGFERATGYTFTGFSGDSGSLANQIKGKTRAGDVFVSASAAKDQLLEGAANGSWVSWYATFATSPLVLAYNPRSRFASELTTKPWYQVVTEPGFLIGRTDPATDPKGKLTVQAVAAAATAESAPGLTSITSSTSDVFPENTLVGRLQSGNLDAGFFYKVEATAAHLTTVPLTGVPSDLEAKYTVTVLAGAAHHDGADAFVGYLLGPEGSTALEQAGLALTKPPTVSGTVPADLRAVVPGS